MTEPPLDRPGIMPLVGERIAAGVAKHVWMRLQLESGPDGRALDHPGKARGRERRAALADEDEGRRHALALQVSQGPSLDVDRSQATASLDAYSPKYLSAI